MTSTSQDSATPRAAGNVPAAIQGQRNEDQGLDLEAYEFDLSRLMDERPAVPFCIIYDTAHFGDKIGIVSGSKNRITVFPLIVRALKTPYGGSEYEKVGASFENALEKTFKRVGKLKATLFEWDKRCQYGGHAQLIFRLRDQYGESIEAYDITLKSTPQRTRRE